ncbi:oocyte-secreted protein 4A isoform X2 [Cavia porcellus]|uniref:oocyte-secreted protein 4A isoform X2 n=1 Tax=Cavia porcellus TaxID=10141 RepID=UPI002FE3544A
MRITRVLVVLLMGLVSIHGLEDVIITCNEWWLWVKFRWRLLGDVREPRPSELYLGTRCAATGRGTDYLEYFYPLSHCGIISEVRIWGILIESSIVYEPDNSDAWGFLPISCFIQRNIVGSHPFYGS